ncbi:MAG: RNA polymerase sigma factor [Saprospiraceae bacterium]
MYSIITSEPDDRLLLEGLFRSEAKPIQTIYDAVLPSIIYYIRQNGGSETDARDLFQDALMALYNRLREGDFELTCKLKSYLRVVCRNLWLKRLRKTDRESGVLPEGWEAVDLDARMDERLEESEREGILWKHLDALGEGCQQILRWFFTGTSMREIASRLDTSEGYIKKRKHTCKERLVTAIKQDARYQELSLR